MSFDIIFKNRINAILGTEFDTFLEALENKRTGAVRVNPLKGSFEDIECALDVQFDENVLWEPLGHVYTDGSPGKHSLHEAGAYYIQEPSAMSPVHYLDPKPGEKILDLCAAPGGKSTQIATKMDNQGILVSNEIDKKRAQILSLNIERLGIKNTLVTNMRPQQLSEFFEGYFDKILVDAPCSGEGMFRKNDEAIENWSMENVITCAKRQTDILKEAVKMLAPGGKLVYSTCTFAPEEDELQVAKLLSWGLKPVEIKIYEGMIHGDISNVSKVLALPDKKDTEEGFFQTIPECNDEDVSKCTARLWPHRIKGEGHFLAVLTKDGDISLNKGLYCINGRIKAAKESDIVPFIDFSKEFLKNVTVLTEDSGMKNGRNTDKKTGKGKKIGKGTKGICRIDGDLCGTPFLFGDQLYLAPEGMPGINGLTIMRPGLHLGTIKNGRFEPSHSLALALNPQNVVLTYELNKQLLKHDDNKAMEFIGGMSFREQGLDNGWYLITTYGYSLGWAKYAGGILKNHYPKGLRIYI
ncbi:RsmB/NOP family class I SAM-dependent RNA methyltransferase [Butyrivibrio sp. AE3004]|uniref:RsmB/NOP family class I SAM-dependent RNA methyltransferase n=1 Tax=Butyrivibrio sp. AE3004 TaxID=1506994 RepID=UPI0004945AF5|nr:RsmF rRNA methyltransferase first C-terminal domain-containing protein [Butyrivibrio sp. AE3004]